MRATIRSTRLVVLPVPAAASTSRLVSVARRIRSRKESSEGLRATQPHLLPGEERRARRFLELAEARASRRPAVIAEDGQLLAGPTVGILVGGVWERSRREQVEQHVQRCPGLFRCVRDREALA